jgi:hypothetical protein
MIKETKTIKKSIIYITDLFRHHEFREYICSANEAISFKLS